MNRQEYVEGGDHLACGDCGGFDFSLRYKALPGETHFGGASTYRGTLIAVCKGCSSKTEITTAQPTLKAEGNLCGGWKR